jgi:drug/metabolite transporter (DMT)-like permease
VSAGASAGIGLALLAAAAYNTGLILEKRALGQLPAIDLRRLPRVVGALVSSAPWLSGFGLMLIGLACQVIVLSFAPVSIVQPVIASGVVLVLVLARLILRERLGSVEYACVAVMAVALVALTLSAAGTGSAAGHHANGAALAAVMIPTALAGLLVATSPLRSATHKHRPPASGISFGIGTGLLYGNASLAIKGMSGILTRDHTAAAIAAGVISSPYLYVLAGCSGAAMLLFQLALQTCRASIVVPVSNIVGSVFFLITGTWLFHEHLPTDPAKLALRLAGIVVACLVIIVLSRQPSANAPQPERELMPPGASTSPRAPTRHDAIS